MAESVFGLQWHARKARDAMPGFRQEGDAKRSSLFGFVAGVATLAMALMCWAAFPSSAHAAETVSIGTADELVAYAARVNAGETDLDAELTADIDMTGKSWLPMGTDEFRAFSGTFDGNGFAVANLVRTTPAEYGGLFGVVSGATIRNVSITGTSKVVNARYAGGIAGFDTGGSTFENCQNAAEVFGSFNAGGIVARLGAGSTVSDCLNAGPVNCSRNAGGIAASGGSNCTIADCLNVGSVTGKDASGSGSVVGAFSEGMSVRNSYCLEGASALAGGGTEKSAEDLASGEVAWLLNGESTAGVWKETLASDAHPGFTGETVYKWSDGTYHNSPEPAPKPTELVAKERTSTSLEVEGHEAGEEYGGLEYRIGDGPWQASPVFAGLDPDTPYAVSARYAGNELWSPSEALTEEFSTEPNESEDGGPDDGSDGPSGEGDGDGTDSDPDGDDGSSPSDHGGGAGPEEGAAIGSNPGDGDAGQGGKVDQGSAPRGKEAASSANGKTKASASKSGPKAKAFAQTGDPGSGLAVAALACGVAALAGLSVAVRALKRKE